MLFDVRTLQRDGWTVVSVVGDVDLASMPTLHDQLNRAEGEQVVLDLSGVDHLDPVTFGVVLTAALRTARRGARFAVVSPPGRPRELFAETRLDEILHVVGSAAELRS